ncbi:MAG: hypothetical protein OXI17_09470 [Gammaproteobacteria bacterium]|nr:hypothetical protein [Gammaproteobacteria bacterium]
MKAVRKAVWISFFVALVVVNALAEAMDYFANVQVAMFYRLTFVLSITVVAAIFAGSTLLVSKLGAERPMSGQFRPREVLACLEMKKTRCTDGAVAGLLGIQPNDLGRILGPKRPASSWVVSASTHRPTGYEQDEMHPDLYQNEQVIDSPEDLKKFIYACRKKQSAPNSIF